MEAGLTYQRVLLQPTPWPTVPACVCTSDRFYVWPMPPLRSADEGAIGQLLSVGWACNVTSRFQH